MTAVGSSRRLDPDALADLEEQRDFLLRSLDDLEREREAGEIEDDDYHHLHDDYTRRAADVLRALEEGRAAFTATPARRASWPRRLLVLGAVGALAVGAGVAVQASSGTRLAGETFTGSVQETASGQLQRAATLAQEGEVTEALRIYDDVLADDPEHLEALSERGLLLVSLGQGTQRPAVAAEGRASIERALAVAPENARALFYLGLALRLEGDRAASDEAFERALATDPPPALRRQIEQFQEFAEGASGRGMPSSPQAPGTGEADVGPEGTGD
jgi:tetratricopeptide (TPR) repeat protein